MEKFVICATVRTDVYARSQDEALSLVRKNSALFWDQSVVPGSQYIMSRR